MKLTKTEIKDLARYGYNANEIIKPNGQLVGRIIVISHGHREVHDSGYPFIKIIGVSHEDGKLIDLGWHDHYISYVPVNTDSLGKNIFRVFPWAGSKPWKISDHFISCSTFQIGNPRGGRDDLVTLS